MNKLLEVLSNEVFGILSLGVCALLCVGFGLGLYILVKNKAPEILTGLWNGFACIGIFCFLDELGIFKIFN